MKKTKIRFSRISKTSIILAMVCVIGLSGLVSCNKTTANNAKKAPATVQVQKDAKADAAKKKQENSVKYVQTKQSPDKNKTTGGAR